VHRFSGLVFPLFLVVALGPGCQRGCLADWLKKGTQSAPPPEALPIRAIDCPDGLARCVGGTIEVSRVARIVQPCSGGPESKQCACPWDAVDTCPRGCASEGTEIIASADRASARLCAPDPLNPVAVPATGLAAPADACEGGDDDTYRCVRALVVACPETSVGAATPTVIATCLRGCVAEGESVGQDETNPEAATRILCAR
jgi:hypothetical protein